MVTVPQATTFSGPGPLATPLAARRGPQSVDGSNFGAVLGTGQRSLARLLEYNAGGLLWKADCLREP